MSREVLQLYAPYSGSAPLPICPNSPMGSWEIPPGVHECSNELTSLSLTRDSLQNSQQRQRRDHRPLQRAPVSRLPESKLIPNESQSHTNLIVRNLAVRVDESALKRIFSAYGEIVSAAVMRNIHTGGSLGTAFVRFATTEHARNALANCHGRVVYGRALSVQWAKRQHDDTPVGEARKKIVKLFVRNIPLDVGAEEVRRLFERFGAVESVTLHKDTAAASHADVGQPLRRIAFVTFVAEGVADRAAEAVHNTRPFASHGPVPLMVKLAEDHSERRATAAAAAGAGGGSTSAAPTRQKQHQQQASLLGTLTAWASGDTTPSVSDADLWSTGVVHAAASNPAEAAGSSHGKSHSEGTKRSCTAQCSRPLGSLLDAASLSWGTTLGAEGLPQMSPVVSSPSGSGSDPQCLRCYVHDPYNPSRSRLYLDEKQSVGRSIASV